MEETQILEYLIEKLSQKLRPMLFEIINVSMTNIGTKKLKEREEDDLLTVAEVMSFFSISRPTVYNWQKKGLIQSHKIGSKVYYKKKELFKSIKARKVT